MNAHTPTPKTPEVSPVALSLAAGNTSVLRALLDAGQVTGALSDLARLAEVPAKNIGRTVDNLIREGLVVRVEPVGDRPGGWAITDAGSHALAVADFAAGRLEFGGDADIRPLLHAQIRPNPHQPRQHFPREELDGLKAAIVAAGEVLQVMLVYPAGADGVHDLADGERRWRVVGELIQEGVWPSDRPLRSLIRQRPAGDEAFIGLITAAHSQHLTKMDEARAFRTLCQERGWSARHAALETGRKPKTVQEMLQVLEGAPAEAIAAFEAGDADWTWERLRATVREPGEAAGDDAVQADIEDLTGPGSAAPPAPRVAPPAPPASLVIGGGSGTTSLPPKPPREPKGPDHALDAVERVTMAELAWKLRTAPDMHHAADGSPLVRAPKYWLDMAVSSLKDAGYLVPIHIPGGLGPHMAMLAAGRAWVDANLPGLDEAVLEAERAKLPNPHGRGTDGWATPWLNVTEAPPPAVEADEADAAEDEAPSFLTGSEAFDAEVDANAHEEADETALDILIGEIRMVLESVRGEDAHWSNRTAGELALMAMSSLEIGQPVAAAVALMGLLGTSGVEGAGDALKRMAGAGQGGAPLLSLNVGDIVSIGGEASGYRLIERSEGREGLSGPSFLAQRVSLKNGKDQGEPRTVTLHAIQHVIRRGEG